MCAGYYDAGADQYGGKLKVAPPVGTKVTIAGWGRQDFPDASASPVQQLQYANRTTVTCTGTAAGVFDNGDPKFICIQYTTDDASSACRGDSGGEALPGFDLMHAVL